MTLSIRIITTKLYCGSRCHGDLFCNRTGLLDPTKTYLNGFAQLPTSADNVALPASAAEHLPAGRVLIEENSAGRRLRTPVRKRRHR